MHNIVFEELSNLDRKIKRVSLTEKVERDNVFVGSRRTSFYKIISSRNGLVLDQAQLAPHIHIFKKIDKNKKFLKWKVTGFLRISNSRGRKYYLVYEHSFWILVKNKNQIK